MNGSVEDAHRRLMASRGHRSNILDARFDAVGISIVHDNNGALFITQDFVDTKASPRPPFAPGVVPRSSTIEPVPSRRHGRSLTIGRSVETKSYGFRVFRSIGTGGT